eukprot:3913337-Rhodomonas_salina.5
MGDAPVRCIAMTATLRSGCPSTRSRSRCRRDARSDGSVGRRLEVAWTDVSEAKRPRGGIKLQRVFAFEAAAAGSARCENEAEYTVRTQEMPILCSKLLSAVIKACTHDSGGLKSNACAATPPSSSTMLQTQESTMQPHHRQHPQCCGRAAVSIHKINTMIPNRAPIHRLPRLPSSTLPNRCTKKL